MKFMISFGLPPASHEDDPFRATQAAAAIRSALRATDPEAGIWHRDRTGFLRRGGRCIAARVCGDRAHGESRGPPRATIARGYPLRGIDFPGGGGTRAIFRPGAAAFEGRAEADPGLPSHGRAHADVGRGEDDRTRGGVCAHGAGDRRSEDRAGFHRHPRRRSRHRGNRRSCCSGRRKRPAKGCACCAVPRNRSMRRRRISCGRAS